eukprot:CAMPEP_0178398828 /NCGR_PEP_ID=MMETSP0689_2-20121128/14970_1 /TAXON_ID=160604 /ORGANISM="Amphidinium massartii, Strain CS-259" /LENGTH=241 /DNA_ID=CAMNT_0020019595 /DNA_START=173 /DNA_END=898 /DNA_ORIENTATION=-
MTLVAAMLCTQPAAAHNHHGNISQGEPRWHRNGSMMMIMCINSSHFAALELRNVSLNGSHWKNMTSNSSFPNISAHANLSHYSNFTLVRERVMERLAEMDPCHVPSCNATCNATSCSPAVCNASQHFDEHWDHDEDEDEDEDEHRGHNRTRGDDEDDDEDRDEDEHHGRNRTRGDDEDEDEDRDEDEHQGRNRTRGDDEDESENGDVNSTSGNDSDESSDGSHSTVVSVLLLAFCIGARSA